MFHRRCQIETGEELSNVSKKQRWDEILIQDNNAVAYEHTNYPQLKLFSPTVTLASVHVLSSEHIKVARFAKSNQISP